ncbi:hypothetical protein D3C79_1007440 [compost metagenome]
MRRILWFGRRTAVAGQCYDVHGGDDLRTRIYRLGGDHAGPIESAWRSRVESAVWFYGCAEHEIAGLFTADSFYNDASLCRYDRRYVIL